MKFKNIVETVGIYRKAYKNYIRVLMELFVKRNKEDLNDTTIRVRLKRGNEIFIFPYNKVKYYAHSLRNKNVGNFSLNKYFISFQFYDKYVNIQFPSFYKSFYQLTEVFFKEDYKFLEVLGKDVIDIGMNIGDSSIYFSLKGARIVIGIEPYPLIFTYAQKNIELSNIHNCILLNAGYGEDKEITVDEAKTTTGSSPLIYAINGKQIRTYSLSTIISKYNLDNVVIKMDCEGCEYGLLNESKDAFDKINMLQIEYHYGYKELVTKLESVGFKVRFTKPNKSFHPEASNPNMEMGYVYAWKL